MDKRTGWMRLGFLAGVCLAGVMLWAIYPPYLATCQDQSLPCNGNSTCTTCIHLVQPGTPTGQANCVVVDGEVIWVWNRGGQGGHAENYVNPIEEHASAELRDYMNRISGATISETHPLGGVIPQGYTAIALGTPDTSTWVSNLALNNPALANQIAALGDEGFIISFDSENNILYVMANKPQGVLYGTYTLLDYLGVRWFYPATDLWPNLPSGQSWSDGQYWPTPADHSINMDVSDSAIMGSQSPDFKVRAISQALNPIDHPTIETWNWLVRNRMQIRVPFYPGWDEDVISELKERGATVWHAGDSLSQLVPQSTYFPTNPEYYYASDTCGSDRRPCYVYGPDGTTVTAIYQICTSPEWDMDSPPPSGCTAGGTAKEATVVTTAGDNLYAVIEAWVSNHPDLPYVYQFINNDAGLWCKCGYCTAKDTPEEAGAVGGPYVTTRFYKFINDMLNYISCTYDTSDWTNITIQGNAYQNFQHPPEGNDGVGPTSPLMNEMLVAMHGRCYRHSYGDATCTANADLMHYLHGWDSGSVHTKGWLDYRTQSDPPGPLSVVGVYEYFSDQGFNAYAANSDTDPQHPSTPPYLPFEDVVAGDIQALHGMGCNGWTAEAAPPDSKWDPSSPNDPDIVASGFNNPAWRYNWFSEWPTYYMAAKLLWNASLCPGDIENDIYGKYYGAAATHMQTYRTLLSEQWRQVSNQACSGGHFIFGGQSMYIGESLLESQDPTNYPNIQSGLNGLLTSALTDASNASDSQLMSHIQSEQSYFAHSWQQALADYTEYDPCSVIPNGGFEATLTLNNWSLWNEYWGPGGSLPNPETSTTWVCDDSEDLCNWTYDTKEFPYGFVLYTYPNNSISGKQLNVVHADARPGDVHQGSGGRSLELKNWGGIITGSTHPASYGETVHIEFWAKGEWPSSCGNSGVQCMYWVPMYSDTNYLRNASQGNAGTADLTGNWTHYCYDFAVDDQAATKINVIFYLNSPCAMLLDDIKGDLTSTCE